MSKFKVGDTVRRLRTPGNSSTPVGYVGTIRRIEIDCDGVTELYFDGGDWGYDNESNSAWEIASTPTGPVREVTRKEIVPGEYSGVVIEEHVGEFVHMHLLRGTMDRHELRAAAEVLTQLADALEPKP